MRARRPGVLLLVLAAVAWSTLGATPAADVCRTGVSQHWWPGTDGASAVAAPAVEYDPLDLEPPALLHEVAEAVLVPVHAHVITNDWRASDEQIIANVEVLNRAFSGFPAGAPTAFRFELVEITRTEPGAHDHWQDLRPGSREEYEMKAATRVGGPETLNVWILRTAGGLSWGTLPWTNNGKRGGLSDGVVLANPWLTGGGGWGANEGDVLVHEVGHWLGLYHTFQDGCGGKGDHVDDTPPQAVPGSGCPIGADTCQGDGADPIHNYMDYTLDACKTEFTHGQAVRMAQKWAAYRQDGGRPGRGRR